MATFAADEETIDLSKYKNTSYYYNGTIITVDEEQGEDADGNPIYAQAVIVGDGKIAAVAYTDVEAEILANTVQKYNCRRIDLKGQTMIPAFVDPHGHIDMMTFTVLQNRAENSGLLPTGLTTPHSKPTISIKKPMQCQPKIFWTKFLPNIPSSISTPATIYAV